MNCYFCVRIWYEECERNTNVSWKCLGRIHLRSKGTKKFNKNIWVFASYLPKQLIERVKQETGNRTHTTRVSQMIEVFEVFLTCLPQILYCQLYCILIKCINSIKVLYRYILYTCWMHSKRILNVYAPTCDFFLSYAEKGFCNVTSTSLIPLMLLIHTVFSYHLCYTILMVVCWIKK